MAGSGTTRWFGWAFDRRPMTAKGQSNGGASRRRGRGARCAARVRGHVRAAAPAFSARKAGGVKAYQAARTGFDPGSSASRGHGPRDPAAGREPGDGWLDVRLDIETGPGTYVRSLARDLGERLGSGGYLHALRRTEAAGLSAANGRSPDALEALAAAGRLDEALIPVERCSPWTRSCSMRSRQDGSPTAPR